MTEFARLSSDVWTQGENYQTIISNACVSAAKAGCDDPMMRYLSLGYASWPPESRTNSAEAYCQVAMALANSSYPATRKYWTWLWARDQVYNTYGTNIPKAIAEIDPQTRAESGQFSESLRDKTMPPEKIYQEIVFHSEHHVKTICQGRLVSPHRTVVEYRTLIAWAHRPRQRAFERHSVFADKAWQARGSDRGTTPPMTAGDGHNLGMIWTSPVKLWKKRGSSTHPTRAFRPRCCAWNSARVTGAMKWKSGLNAP